MQQKMTKEKTLFKTSLLKLHFSMHKLLLHFAATAINCDSQVCEIFQKSFSPFRKLTVPAMYYNMDDHHIRKQELYKIFKIFYREG